MGEELNLGKFLLIWSALLVVYVLCYFGAGSIHKEWGPLAVSSAGWGILVMQMALWFARD